MAEPKTEKDYKKLRNLVLIRFFLAIVVLGLMFFLTAGTFRYWQAWVFGGTLFIPMFFVFLYLLKNDPELLARRMKIKEKEKPQKLIISISIFIFLIAFLLPGLDHRFGWSLLPKAVVVGADVVFLLGYGFFILVLKENSYASRTIEVEKDQKVISSGPYSIIRHPMYLAVTIMVLSSSLALGSYWAMIVLLCPFLF